MSNHVSMTDSLVIFGFAGHLGEVARTFLQPSLTSTEGATANLEREQLHTLKDFPLKAKVRIWA